MQVALFTDTYAQPAELAELFTHLIHYCTERGVRLDIFRPGLRDAVQDCGAVCLVDVVVKTPFTAYKQWLSQSPAELDFWSARLQRHSYRLVHAVTAGPLGLYGLMLARQKGLPIIASHHPNLPEVLIGQLHELAGAVLPAAAAPMVPELRLWQYIQWFYNQTGGVLVPTLTTQQQLQSRLKVPVALLPAGVDTALFCPKHHQAGSSCQVLYVGPVTREKNINVLAELLKGRTDCRLVIVGQGAYLSQMRELCPQAEFHEHADQAALAEIYAGSDLFVSPATTDGSSDAILKALASGLPVVLTNKSSQHELIHDGRDGFVIGTTAQLRQRLDQLIHDAELRQTLSLAARETALRHAWPHVCQTLLDAYQQMH